MSVTMRIVQRFDIRQQNEFLAVERKFAELEAARPDYPKARRMVPLAAAEPCNTLIWECEFPTLEAAHRTLALFHGDADHERLLAEQLPYFQQVRVEFYENLEIGHSPAS